MREEFAGDEDTPETLQLNDFHARPPEPELLVGSNMMSSQRDTEELVDTEGAGYTGFEGAPINTETDEDTYSVHSTPEGQAALIVFATTCSESPTPTVDDDDIDATSFELEDH